MIQTDEDRTARRDNPVRFQPNQSLVAEAIVFYP